MLVNWRGRESARSSLIDFAAGTLTPARIGLIKLFVETVEVEAFGASKPVEEQKKFLFQKTRVDEEVLRFTKVFLPSRAFKVEKAFIELLGCVDSRKFSENCGLPLRFLVFLNLREKNLINLTKARSSRSTIRILPSKSSTISHSTIFDPKTTACSPLHCLLPSPCSIKSSRRHRRF